MVTRPVPSSVVSLNTTQYVVAAETAGFVVQVKVCTPTVSIGSGSLSMPTGTPGLAPLLVRSEEHTSELQSLMRISYAVFFLQKKQTTHNFIIVNIDNIPQQK